MWDFITDLNWELIIALGALGLSAYTFYVQNVKEEIAIYPYEKEKIFYITLENTGKSSIRDYTLQVVKMEHMNEQLEKLLNNMYLLHRKAKFSLPANKTTSFTVGSAGAFLNKDYLPIITFDVYNAKGRKVDTFVCDFNVYRHQMTITITTSKENRKDRVVRDIGKSLEGIHIELAKRNESIK